MPAMAAKKDRRWEREDRTQGVRDAFVGCGCGKNGKDEPGENEHEAECGILSMQFAISSSFLRSLLRHKLITCASTIPRRKRMPTGKKSSGAPAMFCRQFPSPLKLNIARVFPTFSANSPRGLFALVTEIWAVRAEEVAGIMQEVEADRQGDKKRDDHKNGGAFPKVGIFFKEWNEQQKEQRRHAIGDIGIESCGENDAAEDRVDPCAEFF